MVSSTTLQLDQSLWPLQILLVCCLGKGPGTQTLPAPNHTPYGSDIRLSMPTLLLHAHTGGRVCLIPPLEVASNVCFWTWEGGSAGPLGRLAYSMINLTLLQRQSTSHDRGRSRNFFKRYRINKKEGVQPHKLGNLH